MNSFANFQTKNDWIESFIGIILIILLIISVVSCSRYNIIKINTDGSYSTKHIEEGTMYINDYGDSILIEEGRLYIDNCSKHILLIGDVTYSNQPILGWPKERDDTIRLFHKPRHVYGKTVKSRHVGFTEGSVRWIMEEPPMSISIRKSKFDFSSSTIEEHFVDYFDKYYDNIDYMAMPSELK